MDFTITITTTPVPLSALRDKAAQGFGDVLKAVVDVERGIMAVGGEYHYDEEQLLLESGSEQAHLWGINLRPDLPFPDCVEFDSMINLRPSQGNKSRGVDDPDARQRLLSIVQTLVYAQP